MNHALNNASPDVVRGMKIKVFNLLNLISRINETRQVARHETCTCKCKLDEVFVMINNGG